MKKFRVATVDGFNYTLKGDGKGFVNVSLQFYDIEPPQVGEHIVLSETYFDKAANEGITHFTFGKFTEPYGRTITPETMKQHANEILVIERGGQKFYLKRLYG